MRAPSLFSMTRVLLPSITATQLLVVPRSIPMIFPISLTPFIPLDGIPVRIDCYLWRFLHPSRGRLQKTPGGALFRCSHCDQGRAQDAVGNHVALLQHANHRVGRLVGGHHGDSLVVVGVEFFSGRRVDRDDLVALQRCV
ncbi:hypothetical protein D3C72_2010450 [compost metagenome]